MSGSDTEVKAARIKEAVNHEMEAQSSSSNQIIAVKKSNNYRCVLCCLFPFRLCMNPNVLPDARGGLLPVAGGKRVRRSSSIPESNPETEEMIRRVWHDQEEDDNISENSSQCNPDVDELDVHSLCSQVDSQHQLGSLDSHHQLGSMDSQNQLGSLDSHHQLGSLDSHHQLGSLDSHHQLESLDSHHQLGSLDSHQLGSQINIDLHGSEITLHLQESEETHGSDYDEVESHLLNSDSCSETNLTVEENLAGELQSNVESLDEEINNPVENDKEFEKNEVLTTDIIEKQICNEIYQTAEINFDNNIENFEKTADIAIKDSDSVSKADVDTGANPLNDLSFASSNEADTSLTSTVDANNDTTASIASSEDTDTASTTDNSFEAIKDTSNNLYDSIYQDESPQPSDCTDDNDVTDETDAGLHRIVVAKKIDSPQLGTELRPVSEKRKRSLISRLKPTKSSTEKDSEDKESLSRKGSFRERLQKKLHKEKSTKSSTPVGSPKASSSRMISTPSKKSPKHEDRKSATKNSAFKTSKGRSLKRISLLVGKQLLSAKKKEYKLINAFSPPPSQFCIGLPMVRAQKVRPDPFEAVTNVLYMKRNQH